MKKLEKYPLTKILSNATWNTQKWSVFVITICGLKLFINHMRNYLVIKVLSLWTNYKKKTIEFIVIKFSS